MVITAKFAGECKKCGGPIQAGARIEWEKGKGSWHVTCPELPAGAKRRKEPVVLNSAPVRTPQTQRLSEEQAQEILTREGRQFVRPLPAGVPTLRIGDTVVVEGKELSIGTCGEWVGIATDWSKVENGVTVGGGSQRQHVVSLIDGAILESGEYRETHGIDYWTRELGAPLKMERQGRGSVQVGETFRHKGRAYIVISVDKPYYMSRDMAEDLDQFGHVGNFTPYECREVTLSEAEKAADAAAERAKQAAAAVQEFGKRVRALPASEEQLPREAKRLRRWNLANHPSHKAPYYNAVGAYELPDGRKAYRYTDDYYDWPQDVVYIVDEFFTDEPEPTEVSQ